MDTSTPTRRTFFRQLIQGTIGMSFLASQSSLLSCTSAADKPLVSLLLQAGNALTEQERYTFLLAAQELPNLSPDVQSALAKFVNIVRHFAVPREIYEALPKKDRPKRYMTGFFNGHLDVQEHLLPEVAPESPLAPLMGYYRARMLIHSVIQHGWLLAHKDKRDPYFDEARSLLHLAAAAYPDNPVISMYLGKAIPWKATFSPHPNAPEWANQQREILEKLTDTIHWWIDERQVSDGQFGGGWGDDVEMWRNWIPVLVAFQDEKVVAGQSLLSEGLFAQKHMKGGYTDHMTDVEHTAEDSADTCTAMMHLRPDDPVWQERALRIVELMETTWTGINDRGQLQFKSTYFTSEGVDPDPRKACDTVYHPRTIQPALLHWQRTGDERIGKLVTTWIRTWVDASMRAEKGKPAGIVPSAIHWPDGTVGGLPDTWWKPDNHNENPLYDWPSAMYMMLSTMILCFHMSRDRYFLKPLFSMAEIYRKYPDPGKPEDLEGGSEAWCASQMPNFLPEALAKYQKITGDKQFEDIIVSADGDGYAQFVLTGNRAALEADLAQQLAVFQRDEAAYTSEVLWTDRLFSFHKFYLKFFEGDPPQYRSHFLFSMLTGHIGDALYFPINAVKWNTPSREFAAMVTDNQIDRFSADIFHFGKEARDLSATFFLLKPGSYEIRLTPKAHPDPVYREVVKITSAQRSHAFLLPPDQLYRLDLVAV